MKKLTALFVLLSILPNLVFVNSAYSKDTNKKKKTIINITKTEDTQKNDNDFDFRKVKWGMTHQQVHSTERNEPFEKDEFKLSYLDKLLGIDTKVNYFFENGKLISSSYNFEGTYTKRSEYIVDFKKIKDAIVEKYGRPSQDNNPELNQVEISSYEHIGDLVARGQQDFDTKWETKTSNIRLILRGKDLFSQVRIELSYSSKQYKHLDEEKELEKSKF